MTSCAILDGAAIVAMLKPEATKTFSDFASKVFIPNILSHFHKVSRVDLGWDRYVWGGVWIPRQRVLDLNHPQSVEVHYTLHSTEPR